MFRFIYAFASILVLFAVQTTQAAEPRVFPFLSPEPEMKTHIDWDMEGPDMLKVTYDTNGDGVVDYITIRILELRFFSKDSLEYTKRSHPDKRVFQVKYNEEVSYYYITRYHPFLYARDFDGDSHFDLLYRDIYEDTVNGNEHFVGSPSKMFHQKNIQVLSSLMTQGHQIDPLKSSSKKEK